MGIRATVLGLREHLIHRVVGLRAGVFMIRRHAGASLILCPTVLFYFAISKLMLYYLSD